MNIKIYTIRGHRVMLDEDLAKIYGVETRTLNQAIQRNIKRFPEDFMFQLTQEEFKILKSQTVTSNTENDSKSLIDQESLISQFVISKRGGRRKRPFVFTEHGTVMFASVLRSDRAIYLNIEVVKAFVNLRQIIASQKDVSKQISEIRGYMFKRFNEADREFKKVWNAIERMTKPHKDDAEKQIGFRIDD